MRSLTVGDLDAHQRAKLREVALAYRRAYRGGKAAGLRRERFQQEAYEAAVSADLLSVGESASFELLEASVRVSQMIAAAVNADTQWFWHGPDA